MRPRLIPVLTLDRQRRVVKTVAFGDRTYIGDPFNIIRLFNEKEVDEIVVLDIDATEDGRSPDSGFVQELATECFIPLSYGGGLRDFATCEALARLGVEKFVIGTGATDTQFVSGLSRIFGAQAVVGCIDVRTVSGSNRVHVRSGREMLPQSPLEYARRLADAGCGEIILQSIDRDGRRSGCDLTLIRALSEALTVPLIGLGGSGTYDHLVEVLQSGAAAAASGSAFAFIGRLRAVLVTYPAPTYIDAIADRLGRSL